MALRFIDGFDHYTTAANSLLKWSESVGCLFNQTGRRSTSSAVKIPNGNGNRLGKTLDAQNTWIVGGAFCFTLASAPNKFISFIDSAAAYQCSVFINAAQQIVLYRGNGTTVLATSTDSLTLNAWHFIETKLYIHDTAGTFEVLVDGVSVVTYTGDTKSSATLSTASSVSVGFTASSVQTLTFYLDDFYICDGTGTTNNNFLGDVRVDAIYPNGAGASTQFTGVGDTVNTYANIDDSSSDSDTTYNYADTADSVDTFACSDVTTLGATVYGVQTNLVSRKDDAGARTISTQVRISSTNYDGTTQALSDTYVDLTQIWETNPATSTAWNEAVINGAEFGCKVVA